MIDNDIERLYTEGVTRDMTAPYNTLLEAWDSTAARLGPNASIVHYLNTSLSVGHVNDTAYALATALRKLGMRAGDHVGVYVQNDPHWLVTMLATWRLGGTVVAINPMLREKELKFQLTDAQVKFLVCLDELLPIYTAVRDDVDVESVIVTHPADFGVVTHPRRPIPSDEGVFGWSDLVDAHRGETPPPSTPSAEALALLTYTSGTTGRAKGAMNLHRCLAHSSAVFTAWFSLTERDVVLGVAPLFHITGAVACLGVTIASGAPLVLLHRFDVDTVLHAIEQRAATFTVAASTAFIALVNSPLIATVDVSSLTKVASGGAAVSPAVAQRITDATGWQVHGVYGMTETTSPATIVPPGAVAPVSSTNGALSVGIPVPGAHVAVVDVESAQPLPAGIEGEVIVSGPMVVPGYWNAPEESARAIRDGSIFTGDVGVLDTDGWLYIVDRKKDLINAGGYKVWPRDVEDVLHEHPAVKEAAVIGVPDDYRGETVKAFVTLARGKSATAEELIAFSKQRMAAYKYPRTIEILDELPKTSSGKLLRRELKDRGVAR